MFAYEKLPGLPRERLLEAIEPVLRAHGLTGVELVWRTDPQGRVLYVTLESASVLEPGTTNEPGQGVTLEVCSRVSRDLSTAFDVHGLFDGHYRLEVGSPGLERRLYTQADYQRFRGKLAKLKLSPPVAGQSVITGKLAGVDPDGRVLFERDDAPAPEAWPRAIAFEQIRSGQLVVDWGEMGFSPRAPGRRSAGAPGQFAGQRGRASASRPALGNAVSRVRGRK